MRNPFRWLRTRNAARQAALAEAIRAERAHPGDDVWVRGVVGIEDQTPDDELTNAILAGGFAVPIHRDDLMAVADGVFETLCCHRWDVDPDVDGVHTVQHLCVVAIPSHGYHECACGVWRMEIGATP